MKKYKKKVQNWNNQKYILEEDLPEVGWYVFVYDGDFCAKDYLQNNLERAIDFAFNHFGVPKDGWKDLDDADDQPT